MFDNIIIFVIPSIFLLLMIIERVKPSKFYERFRLFVMTNVAMAEKIANAWRIPTTEKKKNDRVRIDYRRHNKVNETVKIVEVILVKQDFHLSDKEKQILTLFAEGYNENDISNILHENTFRVLSMTKLIIEKLGPDTIAKLIAKPVLDDIENKSK